MNVAPFFSIWLRKRNDGAKAHVERVVEVTPLFNPAATPEAELVRAASRLFSTLFP
jgi:hypothetical protein